MSYFKANMHKIRFQNTRPRTGGAHSAPPDPLLDLMGPTSKGREGKTGGLEEREGDFSLYLTGFPCLLENPGKSWIFFL